MTYLVVIVRVRPPRGPLLACAEVEASGPREAAARALVADSRRRRGRRPPPPEQVVADVAGALVETGRWTARGAPGCLLEAWGYRDPLGASVLVSVRIAGRPPGEWPGPSPN